MASAEATMKVQSRSDIVGGRTTEMGSKDHRMGGSWWSCKAFIGTVNCCSLQDGQHQREEIGVNWGTVSNASASASASNCSDEVGLQSMTLFKPQDLKI